ncbi:MAG: hypothetical protein R6V57_00720 [Vicinamibacterales bacterium]
MSTRLSSSTIEGNMSDMFAGGCLRRGADSPPVVAVEATPPVVA